MARTSKLKRFEVLVSDEMFGTLERLRRENRVSMGAIAKAALGVCDLTKIAENIRAARRAA